jgi:Holliday junction resolvase
MLENQIQKQIIDYLEKNKWYVIKLISTTKAGIPDLCAIRDGTTIFIEVKRKGCHPRPLQEHRMNELTEHGVLAFVADSVVEVISKIETNTNKIKHHANKRNTKNRR